MGTATYFSPEQAEGMGVDARSDIYSLGVVLFEMVTGRPPFMGDTPVAVASKHVRENPPTPREINPSVPPDLEAIILKCLAKSPEYRYATGDDLRVDLLRFREGRAVGAVAPPMMAHRPMGTTQALPYSGTQTLAQIAGQDVEEPERSRTGLYAGILAVLLVALAVVVVFLGQSLGWWHLGSGSNTVTLPDVAGQTVTEAEHTLHGDGLKTTVQSDQQSSAPNTQVIRTVPGQGTKVPKGKLVTIVTGGKGNTIPVPSDLVGQSVGSASNDVKALGLQVKTKPVESLHPAEHRLQQRPTAGTRLAAGEDRHPLHRPHRHHHDDGADGGGTERGRRHRDPGVQRHRQRRFRLRDHHHHGVEPGGEHGGEHQPAGGIAPAQGDDHQPRPLQRAGDGRRPQRDRRHPGPGGDDPARLQSLTVVVNCAVPDRPPPRPLRPPPGPVRAQTPSRVSPCPCRRRSTITVVPDAAEPARGRSPTATAPRVGRRPSKPVRPPAAGRRPRKLPSSLGPVGVRIDSGWNWTPSTPSSR